MDSEAEVLGTITRKRGEGGIDLGDENLPVTACITAELTSRARTQPFGQSGSRKNCYVEAARSPTFLARLVSAARRMS